MEEIGIETIQLMPGVTLRCFPDQRFKQGCLSFQLVRPMAPEEVSLNALLPAVLLRGSRRHPDLRSITVKLDELYGALISEMVRRVGDYQTTGLYCGFIEDRFALPGERVLPAMMEFLGELLLEPLTENGAFVEEIVESEKKNLISAMDSQRNDKRVYAMAQMLKRMCKEDSYGIPRLGTRETASAITAKTLYAHYQKILRESQLELFYVGSAPAEQVAQLLTPILEQIPRDYHPIGGQTPFTGAPAGEITEETELTQARLCMGFTTSVRNASPLYAAIQVFNALFGAGMTSKLFMNVREKMSLCYGIGSAYYGSKGMLTVAAGIDADKAETVKAEILHQLRLCCEGRITEQEIAAARAAILSSLRGTHDSLGAIEGFYSTAKLSELNLTPEAYAAQVQAVTREQIIEAARTVKLHTTYLLRGVTEK